MYILFQIIFALVCVFLILVILLQSGKGGDVAAAFGGSGSQTAFGPRGAQKPLEKATIVAAMIFMFLALMFSIPGVGTKSVVSQGGAPAPKSNPATLPSPTPEASPSPAASASPAASGAETKASPEAKASPAASPAKK